MAIEYNCNCEDSFPTQTLAQLQRRVLVHLGMAAMPTPPPGAAELINSFLQSAQEFLYNKYHCFRLGRWFTWNLVVGQRQYDYAANIEACAKKLNARRALWVGVSRGDAAWQQLVEGINPLQYTSNIMGIPRYFELRQCIELWPPPSDASWLLRIKGDFGLLPFAADSDTTTIDAEAVFLRAMARAKAHYRQPDAPNWNKDAEDYVGMLVAGQHPTRRFWPGKVAMPNATPPKMV